MLDVTTSLVLILVSTIVGVLVGMEIETWFAPRPGGTGHMINLAAVKPAPNNPYPVGGWNACQFNSGYQLGISDGYIMRDETFILAFHQHSQLTAMGTEDDPYHCGWIHAARPEYHRVIAKRMRRGRGPKTKPLDRTTTPA